MPTGGAGGNVTVYNSSNITSGTNTASLANSGAAGIRAGILNNNTSVPNAAITGDVTIENRGNITAQAGAGLYAFNYGSGNTSVTFAPGQYSITAINGGPTGTGTGLTQYGIFAFTYGKGSSLVNAGWGTTITSGSTGINAGNQATAIASGSGSTVSVYSQGFISSGTNVNNSGSAPSAIQAGYNPGGNGPFSSAVYGDVIVNVASDGNPFGNPNPTHPRCGGPWHPCVRFWRRQHRGQRRLGGIDSGADGRNVIARAAMLPMASRRTIAVRATSLSPRPADRPSIPEATALTQSTTQIRQRARILPISSLPMSPLANLP